MSAAATGRDRRVLRLTSVFEPRPGEVGDARFDPIGGLQNHAAALTRCLDDLGVRQTVVTARLAGAPGSDPVGARAVVVRVGVRVRRARQLWALLAVPHVLRPGHPVDVVHAHQGEDVGTLLLALLACRVHRAPLVVTLHCSVAHTVTGRDARSRLLRVVGGLVERAAVRRAASVVVLAERTAAQVRADGVPAQRVHVVPSGFEPALFDDPGPDPFPAAGRPRVAYVGRLAAAKRPALVVEAFARLRRGGSQAGLLVVGDGPLRPDVERAVAAADGGVTLHGFVDHALVPAVLAATDVLVLPSAYEELGSVLVEAMASGVPVVATRVGGIPEVVEHGVTGLLVEPGDPERDAPEARQALVAALADAVAALLEDPAARERMGSTARARAAAYSWPGLAARLARLYDEALTRVPAVPGPREGGTAPGRAGRPEQVA